jgi:L-asparaginase/Glu-tRNA(Gln) amidotransferase subunit D
MQKNIDISYIQEFLPTWNNELELIKDPFDLNNLRYKEENYDEGSNKRNFITPKNVKDFVDKLNSLEFSEWKDLVIWIWTGWTIAMEKNDDWKLEPKLDFDKILGYAWWNLKKKYEIKWFDALSTDSSQLEINDVADLSILISYIWKHMWDNLKYSFSWFLVIHWTDTMPNSSNYLAMMLWDKTPFNVVHTWAQKPIWFWYNDAESNVTDSLHLLKILKNNNISDFFTVMWWVALQTVWITKIDDTNAKAMWTNLHKEVINFWALPDENYKFDINYRRKWNDKDFSPNVFRWINSVLRVTSDMSANIEQILISMTLDSTKAILITTYWASTADINVIKAIWEYAKKVNMLVFSTSPVNAKPNNDTYESSNSLKEYWITPLYMTNHSANAKIILAFALFWKENPQQIISFIIEDYIWEIPNNETRLIKN